MLAPASVRVFPSSLSKKLRMRPGTMRRDSINALFNLRAQLRQLAVNLHFLKEELLGAGAALLVALLILAS